MKLLLQTSIFFLVLIPSFANAQCSSSNLVINEIMYRPLLANGANPDAGEMLELIGPPGMDISCYILTDGDWTITFPSGTILPPDGLFSIGNDNIYGAGTFDFDPEGCACTTEGTGGNSLLILTDGGEYIALFDDTGAYIDGVMYGTPTAGNTPPSGATTTGGVINTSGLAGCIASVTIPGQAAFEIAPGGVIAGTSLIRNPDGTGSWTTMVDGSIDSCNVDCGSSNSIAVTACGTYTVPSGDETYTMGGIYNDTIPNAGGCDSLLTIDVTINPLPDNNVTQTGILLSSDQAGALYQWVDCDDNYAMINGETNVSYTPSLTGNYAVEVTLNGCADTSACMLVDYTGIEEFISNPATLVKVIDLMGRETKPQKNQVLIYVFSDGTTKKVFEFE